MLQFNGQFATRACAMALGLSLLLCTGSLAAKEKPPVYGKQMLRSYELSVDDVAALNNAMLAGPGAGGKSAFDGIKDWVGEEFDAPTSGNPFRIVVKVSGTAIADGDLNVTWQPFWVRGNTGVGSGLIIAARTQAKAGELLQIEAASPPLSFKEDRKVAPSLSAKRGRNLRIDSVHVEVWSGIGKSNFFELLIAWSPLLIGVVFLTLAIWLKRR